jgi:tRNA pseudouridine38-40 synthase
MAHYQVTLSYDGTAFAGYQRQANSRTVQAEVEAALKRLGWQGSSIPAAGRTDSGVHAAGQVIAFDLDWRHGTQSLLLALNSYLPEDIAARDASIARDDFHPRYDALWREYHYRLVLDARRDPLQDRYCWRVTEVDPAVLAICANAVIGERDFAAYGTPPRPGSSTIRSLMRSEWIQEGQRLDYYIRANAFLYHMVRRLVFLQVEAARGKFEPSAWLADISTGMKDHPGIAPARGLSLEKVMYVGETG